MKLKSIHEFIIESNGKERLAQFQKKDDKHRKHFTPEQRSELRKKWNENNMGLSWEDYLDKKMATNESNSKFTLNLTTHGKPTGNYPFDTKPEAEAKKKELIKKHELTKQKGFYGNAKTGIELDQNY